MDSANKRIAKNTLFMYVKFFSNMVIGLYTSRLVLEILGVSDYGLFSVVGGVLAMFTFISSSLSSATTRFLNVEMGKKDGDVNQAFNINVVLHFAFAAIIFVLAETIGMWYICNKLNVEPGKMGDAIFVFQVSILTTCMGICNTPYQGMMNAHERFQFMAVFDIVNSFIRLGCILLLSFVPQGGIQLSLGASPEFVEGFTLSSLNLYAIIFSLTTVNSFVVYHYICYRDWSETVKLRFIRGWQKYKEVLVFNNWNLLSTVSNMSRSSGSDMLINFFFGTAVNGAYAISGIFRNYLTVFSFNLESASAPQIVQSYASGNLQRCFDLANKMGRFSILLFEMICFPVVIELDFLLHLWLGKVPEGALLFSYLSIAIAGVSITCGGVNNFINATGRIKWFCIEQSVIFLSCIPIGYLLFSNDFPAYSIVVCFLIADVVLRIANLLLLQYGLHYDVLRYIKEAYLRPFLIAIIMLCLLYGYNALQIDFVWGKLLAIVCCCLLTTALIFLIGLTEDERSSVLNKISTILSLKRLA